MTESSSEFGAARAPAAVIRLRKSRLEVREGHLYRLNSDGTVTAKHPLTRITSVNVRRMLEPFSLILAGGCVGLGAVSIAFINSPFWAWSVAIVLLCVACFALAFPYKYVLRVTTLDAEPVEYALLDTEDEAHGFAASLNHMLRAEAVKEGQAGRNAEALDAGR